MIDRIKQIMEYYNITPASLAEQIGINRSSLTHLFSGRNQPSLDLAKKILHCYPEIKTEWLIMGMGEMMRSDEEKELTIKLQTEKKQQDEEDTEPDLFSTPPPSISSTHGESHKQNQQGVSTQISNSREVEQEEPVKVIQTPHNEIILPLPDDSSVTKIVFFYSGSSFEVFYPKK